VCNAFGQSDKAGWPTGVTLVGRLAVATEKGKWKDRRARALPPDVFAQILLASTTWMYIGGALRL